MKALLFILIISISNIAFAGLPVSKENLTIINETFLDNGQLSQEKVSVYKKRLKKLEKEIKDNINNLRQNEGSLNPRGLDPKKPSKNNYIKYINFLQNDYIEQANLIQSESQLIEHLSNVLDIENALKIQVLPHDLNYLISEIKQVANRYYIPKPKFQKIDEAANLINPATGEYFSQAELSALKASGVDISRFDPPKNNGTIELIEDLSTSDVTERYREGKNMMHAGLIVKFPKENIGYLDEIRKTQSRMKLIFETKDENGKKTGEYKLKMGLEIHSEPTGAGLAVMLGMNQDLSKHVRNIKIYTGMMNWDDFVIDFTSYFSYKDLMRVAVEHGFDKNKNQFYVIFNEGLLEARFDSDKLERIGPFYPGLRSGKREARALMLFNAWIANVDVKPGENNKLLRRTDTNQLFYSQHDLGYGFGYFEREKPTDFPWDIVLKDDAHGVLFDFRNIVPNPDINIMGFYDAKWMTRKIAQLTRAQITEAVKLGNWPNQSPYNYEQLIIEKLINRRNQLVQTFDVLGETLPNGEVATLMYVNRDITKDAKITTKLLPGYTSDFRPALKYEIIYPALEKIKETILNTASNAIANIGKVDLPNEWFGISDAGVTIQALFGSGKKVVKNPNPANIGERYLVRENFKIGTRIGYGEIFSADTAIVKEYSLIYPVEDESMVSLRGKWLLDFSVPYSIMKNYLPPKHILISETYLEGRGRLRVEFPTVGPGGEATLSRINLSKQIMFSQNGETKKYMSDKTNFTQATQAVFTKLGIVRIKHFKGEQNAGSLVRNVFEIDRASTKDIDRVVMNNEDKIFTDNPLVLSQVVQSDFDEYMSRFSIFTFFLKKHSYSADDILVYEPTDSGGLNQINHQIEGRYIRQKRWQRIFVSEDKIADVTMSAVVSSSNELITPEITLDFLHHDTHTTAYEIDEGHIPFFNGAARDENFINYSASEHAITQFYGELEVNLKQIIHKAGIKKILKITSDDYILAMSKLFGIDDLRSHNFKYVMYQGRSYKRVKLLKKARLLMSWILKAQRSGNNQDKLHKLVRAIGSAIPGKGQSQNPILLATLNSIIGEKNYYMEAYIAPPIEVENKFPGDIVPFNSQGKNPKGENRTLTKLRAYESVELWEQF